MPNRPSSSPSPVETDVAGSRPWADDDQTPTRKGKERAATANIHDESTALNLRMRSPSMSSDMGGRRADEVCLLFRLLCSALSGVVRICCPHQRRGKEQCKLRTNPTTNRLLTQLHTHQLQNRKQRRGESKRYADFGLAAQPYSLHDGPDRPCGAGKSLNGSVEKTPGYRLRAKALRIPPRRL